FAGRPCNPQWSDAAKRVYEGLTQALPDTLPTNDVHENEIAQTQDAATVNAELQTTPDTTEPASRPEGTQTVSQHEGLINQLITNRQEAIEAGALIDVSREAEQLGFTFSVTITKPLWEIAIAPEGDLSEKETAERLRDVLMAFRLCLAGKTTISPLIDFPAMLALPPGTVPQPVPLFALIQPDEQNRAMATLLLPNEVTATIIPRN
ncbi:MAG: hypothetical protein OEY86_17895, partial [Nitrospira sp.]|nr:hypothetical protein [Nitrospira sp.]